MVAFAGAFGSTGRVEGRPSVTLSGPLPYPRTTQNVWDCLREANYAGQKAKREASSEVM